MRRRVENPTEEERTSLEEQIKAKIDKWLASPEQRILGQSNGHLVVRDTSSDFDEQTDLVEFAKKCTATYILWLEQLFARHPYIEISRNQNLAISTTNYIITVATPLRHIVSERWETLNLGLSTEFSSGTTELSSTTRIPMTYVNGTRNPNLEELALFNTILKYP